MRSVLIVDDNRLDRMIHRRWLEKVYAIAEADNTDCAIVQALATPFDCILLDHVMPQDDGLHAIKSMRAAIPRCPPIILLSCALTEDLSRNASALGASACGHKPVTDGSELLAMIETAIAKGTAA